MRFPQQFQGVIATSSLSLSLFINVFYLAILFSQKTVSKSMVWESDKEQYPTDKPKSSDDAGSRIMCEDVEVEG